MSIDVLVPAGALELPGTLTPADDAVGAVVFAHGSGSSRQSPRNVAVARHLNLSGFTTLLFDLLSPEEAADRDRVFDIPLLTERLTLATRWLAVRPDCEGLGVGLFGASTGAAAALGTAAALEELVRAVVSRGGRPDLAGEALERVRAPTLLIVGGLDLVVLELNRTAQARLPSESRLEIVEGATHLFEEPGTLERVTELATSWFLRFASR